MQICAPLRSFGAWLAKSPQPRLVRGSSAPQAFTGRSSPSSPRPLMKSLLYTSLTFSIISTLACGDAALASQDGEERWTQPELEAVTAEIQAQVEAIRGEEFVRPVAVKITDAEGFLGYALARMDEMAGKAKLAAQEDTAKMLGLVPPTMDLWGVTLEVLEGQVGGFYDPGTETFFLMDSFTGGIAKIILSHELTHALDDQLYDIDGTLEGLLENDDATAAYQAVVEGSGTAIMSRWTMEHISELDPMALVEAASMGTDSLAAAPPIVWKPMLAAYVSGQQFLDRGYRVMKKSAGLDFTGVTKRAFESPPLSTEQVLHPDKYWMSDKRDDPIEVSIEWDTLPAGWKRLDETTLGELTLALMTQEDEKVDFSNPMSLAFMKYTNKAVEGWGGDRLVLLGSEKARLLHLFTVWDTPKDAKEFAGALSERLAAWRGDLATLDAEGLGAGVSIGGPEQGAETIVTISAWYGLPEADYKALTASLRVEVGSAGEK